MSGFRNGLSAGYKIIRSILFGPLEVSFQVGTYLHAMQTASTIPLKYQAICNLARFALPYPATIVRLIILQSVLVHSATGGVDIAAIQFAKHIGAEISAL